jgi:teichuronic acid biosynthesis glycosyltransferase TuaC
MRVLFVSQMFPRPERPLSGTFIVEQARALRESGVDVAVLCPVALRPPRWRRAVEGWNEVEDVPAYYLPYTHVPLRVSTSLEARSLGSRIMGFVRSRRETDPFAILHAHQVFPTGCSTARVGAALGIPVVCTAHGSDLHKHPKANRGIARLTREALRITDLTVTVSRDLARRAAELEPAVKRLEVVYSGVDLRRFTAGSGKETARRALGLPIGGTGFCFVGRLVAEKGLRELLTAFQRLVESGQDVWLIVVGDGPSARLAGSVNGPVRNRLILAGPVPHARVSDYLRAADVFVLPSYGEGVPVSMLEAMASGLPSIVTSVGGIEEVLTDGRTGLVVQPRDIEGLRRAMEVLAGDPDLRETMGSSAQQVIAERHTWSQSAKRLAELYKSLV